MDGELQTGIGGSSPAHAPENRRRPGDRLPPYSEESERGILGCLLLDAERVWDLCQIRRLGTESFYLEAHRAVYEGIAGLAERHLPVSTLTVIDRLRETGRLDSAGGEDGVMALAEGVTTTAHAEYFADRVADLHLMRRLIRTCGDCVEACYGGEKTGREVVNEAGAAMFELGDESATGERSWGNILSTEMAEINQIVDSRKPLTGISTGFPDLDKMIFGMHGSELLILAARPSMGKTSLALNIAENVAFGSRGQDPMPVAVFSLEMSAEALARRMVCGRAGVSNFKLSSGMVGQKDHAQLMRAAEELSKVQLFVDDTAGLEVPDLRARARRLKKRHNIGLVVVDYLGQMHYSKYSREGLQRETAAISQAMKEMAKELKIPVLVLSQLNRAAETRDAKSGIPKLSDLRDSGAIEQDADVVMLLRRPSRYKDDPEAAQEHLAIVDVAKHRNGPTGIVKLYFDGDLTRFGNWTEMAEPDGVSMGAE